MARRNESFISPADLESAGIFLFGADNWRAAMVDYMGCDLSLIWRYMTVRTPIPKPFAIALRALVALKEAGKPLPTIEPLQTAPEPISLPVGRPALTPR